MTTGDDRSKFSDGIILNMKVHVAIAIHFDNILINSIRPILAQVIDILKSKLV